VKLITYKCYAIAAMMLKLRRIEMVEYSLGYKAKETLALELVNKVVSVCVKEDIRISDKLESHLIDFFIDNLDITA
jgi:hypothetical protein